MDAVTWLGNIAATSGAVKSGGADGGGRVTLDIPDNAFGGIVAALIALRGRPVRVAIVADDAAAQPADDDADELDALDLYDDDGSRWNDDADGQALASVYGANDE